MEKSQYNFSSKDKRLLYKWSIISILWAIVAIVILCTHSGNLYGLWFLITGLFMFYKRKDYENWYNRVYIKPKDEKQ